MAQLSLAVLLLLGLLQLAASASDRYVWIGPVNSTSVGLRMDLLPGETQVYLADERAFDKADAIKKDLDANRTENAVGPDYGRLHSLKFKGLTPSTRYYVFVLDKSKTNPKPSPVADFYTFPTEGKTAEVVVGLGSCQVRARDAGALRELAIWKTATMTNNEKAAFFMLHMGDLHYGNIGRNSTKLYERATRAVVTEYFARRLFSSTPVAYMPDDHDFGANNADSLSESRWAVQKNFRAMTGAPTLPSGAMFHSFTVANVRFILTDLRSNARRATDSARATALGNSQRLWLEGELKQADKFDAVVWMSTRPWISANRTGSDTWGGFHEERRVIANFIAKERISNLVMVSGDAHMVAADDGTYSMYADDPSAKGFPVMHASPLAQFGSSKGGPYSEGCKAFRWLKNYQYGILTISPKVNGKTTIKFNGYTVSFKDEKDFKAIAARKPIISFTASTPFLAKKSVAGGGQGKCSIPLAPWWYFLIGAMVLVLLGLVIAYCAVKQKAKKQAKMIALDPNGEGEFAPLEAPTRM